MMKETFYNKSRNEFDERALEVANDHWSSRKSIVLDRAFIASMIIFLFIAIIFL